jgi:hypothetical protein
MMVPMDADRRAQLTTIMAAAADDPAAGVRLYLEFGPDVGRVVRFLVRRAGGRHWDDDDLAGLTFDACQAIAALARSWRPDGAALPWVWARGRIAGLVADAVGPPCDPLPSFEDGLGAAPPLVTGVRDGDDVAGSLTVLAGRDERCARLGDALGGALTERDAEVLLRYRIQQQSGDPAPSETVAAELGLRPPTVRQVASRARRKLAAAVADNPSYASLAGIALLDAREAAA